MLDCQLPDPDAPPPAPRTTSEPTAKPKWGQRKQYPTWKERMAEIREKERLKAMSDDPDPWLTRKFAVGFVIALYAYAWYVYVIRLCVPMVRHEDGAQGSRNQGITYLVLYHLLFLMFNWSYWMVLATPPGSAKDLVPLSDPPEEKAHLVSVDGYRFADRPSSSRHLSAPDDDDANQHSPVDSSRRSSLEEPTIITAVTNSILPAHESTSTHPHSFSVASNPHSSIAAPAQAALIPRPISRNSSHPDIEQSYDDRIQRIPDRVPVLTDSYRYDRREGLMRPYRSHRCRHCAAVILNYDHHCPYIGHCVGARNRKYFFNFLQWATPFCFHLFVSLIISNTATRSQAAIDGNQIAIMVISGVFFLFTVSLLGAHTRLLLLNLTTVEDMSAIRMKARERATLAREFGFWNYKERKATQQRWDEEWGRIGREGNLWYLGSYRANWEMVMGKSKLGWILPIPAKPTGDDGLSYVPNPRFSEEGFWRRRKYWPRELR